MLKIPCKMLDLFFSFFFSVLRRRHFEMLLKSSRKWKRISVPTGAGNHLYGKIRHQQKFFCLAHTNLCQVPAWRHMKTFLKQRIKITSVYTYIIRNVCYLNILKIIVSDKFHCSFHIKIFALLSGKSRHLDILWESCKETVKKPF